MDLFRGQRKLLLSMAAGTVALAAVVVLAVSLSSSRKIGQEARSTEATTSPALNALLADVDQPPGPTPAPDTARRPTVPPKSDDAPRVSSLAPVDAGVAAAPGTVPDAAPVEVAPAPTPAKPAPVLAKRPPAPRPPPKPPAPKEAKGNTAERTAADLYKAREFDRAATILEDAASKERGAAAERLETTAKDYASVGLFVTKGDQNAQSNPAAASTAYKQAYILDARAGRGAHATYLKTQLAKVLPRAALAHMQAGKFELARGACDDAAAFGAGTDPTVIRVRNMLESKAKELYAQGAQLVRSKPDEAKALWRRVLKMVPAESQWYTKSYAALNKSAKGAAQDEDE